MAGGDRRFALACAVVALLLTLGLLACGEGESTTAPTGTTSAVGDGANGDDRTAGSAANRDSPSAAFEVPGGDNSVQRFGEEAGPAERRRASAVVDGYMDAITANDFAAQCRLLTRASVEPLERATGSESGASGCAKALSQLRAGTQGVVFGAMAGPVGSLRVEGTQGFALYHGEDGIDYVLPLKREGGEWKVTSLVPVKL